MTIVTTLPMKDSAWRKLTGAEKLVGAGFRAWMTGYNTQDISSWEACWNEYSTELGPRGAKQAIADLSYWVRTVKEHTARKIETFPNGCSGFCKDECLAVSVVAACQHKHCPALQICAAELIGSQETDKMIETAEGFAYTLSQLDIHLGKNSVNSLANVA